jgi:hypothetical protein
MWVNVENVKHNGNWVQVAEAKCIPSLLMRVADVRQHKSMAEM